MRILIDKNGENTEIIEWFDAAEVINVMFSTYWEISFGQTLFLKQFLTDFHLFRRENVAQIWKLWEKSRKFWSDFMRRLETLDPMENRVWYSLQAKEGFLKWRKWDSFDFWEAL